MAVDHGRPHFIKLFGSLAVWFHPPKQMSGGDGHGRAEVTLDLTANDGAFVSHRLRHTFATALLSGGMNVVNLMAVLGHRDHHMTMRPNHKLRVSGHAPHGLMWQANGWASGRALAASAPHLESHPSCWLTVRPRARAFDFTDPHPFVDPSIGGP